MRRKITALITLSVLAVSSPAWAVNPDEILSDPIMEQRARDISANLRCLVCQNQSIDDSDAELARDLRVIVRERLVSGDSDSDVMDYVVGRYGEFVLLRPQFSTQNLVLWATPILILLLGGIAAFTYSRRNSATLAGAPLSLEEENRLTDLLGQQDEGAS